MAETKSTQSYFYGTGRRKSAVARVRILPSGSGKVTINDKVVASETAPYLNPLRLVGKLGSTDLSVKVAGGGTQGQLDAIQHGVARALLEIDETFRTTLKKAGFLTRDPREKERKKFGLKGARRAPQWSKR